MYVERDSSELFDLMHGQKPDNGFKKYETIIMEVTRIKTLVETDELLQKIVNFAKGKYCKENHVRLTLEDAKTADRSRLLYYIVDKNRRSGYREIWSTSRWEDDYCDPYFDGYDKVSFNQIISKYLEEHPNDAQWTVEEKVRETDRY